MKEKQTCCICKKEFIGYGNSPWPLKEEGLCCDECNVKVIYARLNFAEVEKEVIRKRKQAEYHKQYNLRRKALNK